MSAQDNIDEAKAQADGGPLGALIALLIFGSCANTPKNVNQDKKPEKVPVKIEHRESPATNQFYKVRQSCLIHLR